ncbi:MAG: hypothetical protein RLZZ127_150 [Planctomycetota bacterium]|jgi:hypothetical protein
MPSAAYYFGAHLYTLVPRHVREDLAWIRGHGGTAVVLGVLEQDLGAARENIAVVAAEAERAGLELWMTPSRWGNLVAGAPKVPSTFCATRHEAWVRNADGSPALNFLGPVASVHHPATFERFAGLLATAFRQWPVRGIVWDEPKALHVADHSPAALAALGGADPADPQVVLAAQCAFFGRVNAEIRRLAPQTRIGLFGFAHDLAIAPALCAIPGLDAAGCDGRPWRRSDGGQSDERDGGAPTKFLLGDGDGEGWLAAARAAGRAGLWLIENHALPDEDLPLMDRRLPEVLAAAPEWLLWYYYPRSLSDPDAHMAVLGRHLCGRG